MAAHPNRSPSPLCSRPTNPTSRNLENDSGNRRSFSGNNPFSKPSSLTNPRRFDPVTPANSPSDFARKLSVGEEKENDEKEHMLKASKFQSPAKGSKNFMSPTISAASKFTPSPRKRVLVDRNDPVRTLISLSDGKAMSFSNMSPTVSEDFDSKSKKGFHQNQNSGSFSDRKVADSVNMEVDQVPKPSKRVSFADVPSDSSSASESQSESVITNSDCLKCESVSTDSDSLKVEPSSKNGIYSAFNSIALLDADPSLPPYDPKTNYLSPRPQFLHYKPNPRIGILLNREKELDPEEFNRLDDKLMAEILSESFSDSSEGTEESQTESTQNEEMEVASPADMVIGMDEMEADSHTHLSEPPSEPLPLSTHIDNSVSEDDFVQKSGKKSRALFILMCFSMLLMFLIASVSISVSRSPSLEEFVPKDISLSDVRDFYHQSRTAAAASVKVNFDRLVRHVNEFSVSSVSFISKIGNGEKQVQLQFLNTSDLKRIVLSEGQFLENEARLQSVESLKEEVEEDLNVDGVDTLKEEVEEDLNVDGVDTLHEETDSDEKFENGFDSQDDGLVVEMDMFEEEAYAQTDSDEKESMSTESVEVAELEHEIQSQTEFSISTLQIESEQVSVDQSAAIPHDQETNLETAIDAAADTNGENEKTRVDNFNVGSSGDQPAAIPQGQETNLEAAANLVAHINAETEKSPFDITTPSSSPSADAYKSLSDGNTQSEGTQSSSEDNSFVSKAMGISSLFAGFLAIAAFLYWHKREPAPTNIVHLDPPLLSKEKSDGYEGTKHNNIIHQEKEFSQNWQTEVDVNGGESSCSSQMSSLKKGASYIKNGGGTYKVESSERKKTRKLSKRESLASSSMGSPSPSPSYGSFTTYERIPVKHANGDEEIVTPVRRSSRIRNHQAISP